MTCHQLGGACDKRFTASTFDEIGEMSKQHGMEMFQAGDGPHLKAMERMQELMQSPEDMDKWYMNKQKEFNALPED